MENILPRCVKIKSLPMDCSKSTIETILQMAPGEDQQLDKKIEKVHNLEADVRLILFDTIEDADQCLHKDDWVFETGKGAYLISPTRPNMHEVPTDWVDIRKPPMVSPPVPLPAEQATKKRENLPTAAPRAAQPRNTRNANATNVIVIFNQTDESSEITKYVQRALRGENIANENTAPCSHPRQDKHETTGFDMPHDDCEYIDLSGHVGTSEEKCDVTDNVYMELTESDESNGELGHDLLNTEIKDEPVISQSPNRNSGRLSIALRRESPPIPPRRSASHLMPSAESNRTPSPASKEGDGELKPPLPPRKYSSTKSNISKSHREIVVKGAPPEMNTYELLDHMKRRSLVSDEDIEDVSYRPIERETLFLCQSKKAAENIISAVNENNQSIIQGSTLTAVLHVNYPYDTHKLLITGLSETFTKENISNEMLLLGQNPTNVSVAESHAAALVSFDDVIDVVRIESLNEKCLERKDPFKFSPVQKTNCIKASCLGPGLEDSALRYYFDHVESSGEEGNTVDIVHGKKTNEFIISFRDGYDLETVCQKEVHLIEGHDVYISMYYPCLEVNVVQPPPFLYPLSQYIRRFVQNSNHYKKDLMDILGKDGAKIQWPPVMDSVEYIEIKCLMAYTDLQDDLPFSKWKHDCTSTLNDICKRWDIKSIYVAEEAWREVKTGVKKMAISDDAYIEYVEKCCTIVVSGEGNKVKALVKKIQGIASNIEVKYSTLRKRLELKKYELDILRMLGATSTFPKSLAVKELESWLELEGTNEDIETSMKIVTSTLRNCDNEVIQDDDELYKKLFSCQATMKYIYQKLHEEHLQCVFAEILDELRIFSRNEDETRKVFFSVNRLLQRKEFSLNKKMRNHFDDNDSDAFLVKLEQKHEGQMKYKLCTNRLIILCVGNVFEKVCEAIALFMDLHSDFNEVLYLEPGELEWIDRHRKSCIDSVIERFKTSPDPLKITKIEGRNKCGFSFSGIKSQCKEAMLSIIDIRDSVMRKDHYVMWSNFDKFLTGAYGVNHLTECEENTKCVIKFSNDKLKTDQNSNLTVAEYRLQDCSIKLTCCNLTEIKADYLVRPTSATFAFASELSREILREGGTSIQDECEKGTKSPRHIIVTSAGLLPSRGIMHVVLDKWSETCPDNEKALQNVITNCMREADNLDCISIAFPVIYSDKFCLPADIIAKNMLSTIRNYWREVGPETNVNNVYICDVNENLLKSIVDKSKDFFPRPKSTTGVNEPCGAPEHIEGVRPCIMHGNIELQEYFDSPHQVDVIVNVTNKRMDLQSAGSVSKQLVNTGGKSILTDCRTKYPNGISVGDIALTSGGRLKCKKLFHGVLLHWDEGQGLAEMVLRCFVSTCLQMANVLKYTSIALPALGTGYLGFPANVAAKVMFEEVIKFGNKFPKSNLRDVRFVVFPGSPDYILEAFEKCRIETTRRSIHSDAPITLESLIVNKNGYSDTIGQVRVYTHHGDITTAPATAFVNVTSDNLQLESGNISRRVLAAAGTCIQHEADSNIQDFKDKGLTVTSAGRLLQRKIIHMKGHKNINGIKKLIRKLLIETDRLGLTSLALPMIGTGCVGFSTDKIVKTMLESFNDFIYGPDYKTYLRTIILVVYEKNDLEVVISEMMKFFSPGKKQAVQLFKGKDNKSDVHGKQKLTFHVHGDSIENINEAIKFIDSMEVQKSIAVSKSRISQPVISKIEELKKIGSENGVNIVHSAAKDRISINGFGNPAKVILEYIQQEVEKIRNSSTGN